MKSILVLFLLICINNYSQSQNPLVDIKLTVKDNNGSFLDLRFGLDPTATDGIDTHLGEAVLPPYPPTGVFDARFNLANYESSLKDYRTGSSSFIGEKVHNIRYQLGTGNKIIIIWEIPLGIKGRLQDIVTGNLIDMPMIGIDSFTVDNPQSFNKLKMTIEYTGVINSITESDKSSEIIKISNFPNPFNSQTTIYYEIENPNNVKIELFSINGEKVLDLKDEFHNAGKYTINLNAEKFGLKSGLYFYRLISGKSVLTGKLILLK